MIINDDLTKVDNHWTLSAFDKEFIKNVFFKVNEMSAQSDIGNVITFDFQHDINLANDIAILSSAYETAAIEYMIDFLKNGTNRNLFIAASWKLFELMKNLPLPNTKNDLIFHVLHLSSVAYCAERWNELRNWYSKQDLLCMKQNDQGNWDETILGVISEIWIILFTKSDVNTLE